VKHARSFGWFRRAEAVDVKDGHGQVTRREFIQRAALGGVALGFGGELLSACRSSTSGKTGSSPQPLNRDPSTLIVAVDAFDPNFDPASYFVNANGLLNYSMYEGLLRIKPGTVDQVDAALAQTWTTNHDKSVWTFKLRSGVKFWDGTPLTADAVKSAYVRTITIGLGAGSVLGTFVKDPAKQIVVVDPSTLRFDLGAPSPAFRFCVASIWGTGVASPEAFKHSSGSKDQGHAWLQSHAAGTGPYMLESVEPGNKVVFAQNPDYWRGWSGNHFKKVIVQQIPDGTARREAMESGAADLAVPSHTPADTTAMRANTSFTVATAKEMYVEYIILGQYGPLASPAARQAVNYLFPHDAYVKSVMLDTVAPAHGCFPDLLVTHDPNSYVFPTDLQRAKELFTSAGVAPGTELTFEYYTGYGDQAAALLQAQFQQIGLKLRLVQKAYSAFLADLTTPRPVAQRADMYFWSWYPDYDDPADFSWPLLSGQALPADAGFNSGYYENPTVTDLINKGYAASNLTELTGLMLRLQNIVNKEDPPWVPVDQVLDNTYLRNDVKGYATNPLAGWVYNYYPLTRA
jgi:peptide/nickel transport system substrate-binding protein